MSAISRRRSRTRWSSPLPVEEPGDALPLEVMAGDLEVPESDAVEQHLPAGGYDDDSWR